MKNPLVSYHIRGTTLHSAFEFKPLLFKTNEGYELFADESGIDDADDDGDDAGVRVLKHGAGAVALTIDQDRIADPSLGAVDGNEIAVGGLTFHDEGLADQQALIIKMGMTDRGNDRPRDFG